jgi:hypothetical protein
MTHPTPEDLRSYRQRTLPSGELLAVDDHVAGCEECRRAIASGVTAGAASQRAWDAVRGEHVPYARIEQYVQGRLHADERATVAAHAELCPQCRREIADLEEYAATDARGWNWWALAAAAAVVVVAIAAFWRGNALRSGAPEATTRRPAIRTVIPVPAATDSTAVASPDPLQALSPSLQRVVKALESGILPSASLLSSLQPPAEQQRSGDRAGEAGIRLLDPAGNVVETDRPTFRWDRAGRGEDVTVQIYDRSYAVVAESPRSRDTSWRVPAPLPRGATYRWQLRIHSADGRSETVPAPPAPPALFHVLGSESFEELRRARLAGSSLEVGLISIREGLLSEGAQALSRYAAEHPRSAEAARLAGRAALIAKSQRARTATSSTDD